MSEKLWGKIAYFTGLIPLGALFGVVAYLAHVEIKDLDIWLHLGVGKFILLSRYVPTYDILSCTIAGKEWINHEWLFQVLVYSLYQSWGPNGLLIMQAGVVIATLLILFILGYNRDKQLIITLTLFIVSLVYMQRFTVRPDLFSLFFFTLYIFILALHVDKKWMIFVLFGIQVLWTNMHGFFFFGPLFILIGIVSEWMRRTIKLPFEWNKIGRLTDGEFKHLKIALIVSTLACCINPHFVKGAWYPLGVFFSLSGEHKMFFNYIQELERPIKQFSELFYFNENGPYKLLIILSTVSFVFNRRKIDISVFIFWLVFLIFSLKAARNLAFFSLAAYLVIVTNFLNISAGDIIPLRFTGKKFLFITMVAVNILLLAWIFNFAKDVSSRGYYDFDRYVQKSEFKDVSLVSVPHKAVDFLVENKIEGRFFNDFNSGAYLIGRTFPFIKVFIDGRTEEYGPKFFEDYRSIWIKGDMKKFDEYVEKYHLTGAFLNSVKQHCSEELLKHLNSSPNWKMVYFDHDAVIFLRDVTENKKYIQDLAFDIKDWKTKRFDLKKIGAVDTLPYQNYYRAYELEILDLDDLALEELQSELLLDTRNTEIYALMGKIYAKRKDYKKAFEYFRMAVMWEGNDRGRRHNLAMVYSDMGELTYSIREYNAIINQWPDDPKAYFLLARVYSKSFDFRQAVDVLKKGCRLDTQATEDMINIGDMIFEQGGLQEAKEIFELALETKKDLFTIHRKLAAVYNALGEKEKAKEELNKALQEKNDKLEEIEAVKKEVLDLG